MKQHTLMVEVALNIPFCSGRLWYLWTLEQKPVVGLRVKVPVNSQTLKGVIIQVQDKADKLTGSFKNIHTVLDDQPILGEYTLALAQWISEFCLCSLGEALTFLLPWASKAKEPHRENELNKLKSNFSLNEDQQLVLQEILNAPQASSFFLKGITGSGKTETLLHAAKATLEKGKSVLYLVPEITLAHSLKKSLQRVLQNQAVYVLNSKLSASEKLYQWRRILNNPNCCVVGVRSASLAPLSNLGLIIMDEEQESSYKSESTPRYHTRHIVFLLQKFFQAHVVLTSATPSLESYYAIKKGLIQVLSLKQRIGSAQPPSVELVKLSQYQDLISERLSLALLENHKKGKQAILFLNRRGFFSLYLCHGCGYHKTCPHCSVPLTWHKKTAELRCHYCCFSQKVNECGQACPECGHFPMSFSKIGTQFIEETLQKKFPHIRFVRLDTDVSSQNRFTSQEILKNFEEGQWDVLLGTQMIAKGLNFPRVELVGLILADSSLCLPDFRCYERAYALIRQVIGRAGRFSSDGQVILQALQPEHTIIQLAYQTKDELFYEQELILRQELNFPPFSKLFRLVIRGRKKEQVEKDVALLYGHLKEAKRNMLDNINVEIFAPCECVIERIAGNWRWQILLKGTSFTQLNQLVKRAKTEYLNQEKRKTYLEIDPYPMNML